MASLDDTTNYDHQKWELPLPSDNDFADIEDPVDQTKAAQSYRLRVIAADHARKAQEQYSELSDQLATTANDPRYDPLKLADRVSSLAPRHSTELLKLRSTACAARARSAFREGKEPTLQGLNALGAMAFAYTKCSNMTGTGFDPSVRAELSELGNPGITCLRILDGDYSDQGDGPFWDAPTEMSN